MSLKEKLKGIHPNYWMFLVASVLILNNTIVHRSSPAYKYYVEEFSKVKTSIEDFKREVREEIAPSIESCASNILARLVVDSPVAVPAAQVDPKNVAKDDFLSPFLDVEASYTFVDCRALGQSYYGGYIDGWFYHDGQSYMGRKIISFNPECVILDRGVIRPRRERVGNVVTSKKEQEI